MVAGIVRFVSGGAGPYFFQTRDSFALHSVVLWNSSREVSAVFWKASLRTYWVRFAEFVFILDAGPLPIWALEVRGSLSLADQNYHGKVTVIDLLARQRQ